MIPKNLNDWVEFLDDYLADKVSSIYLDDVLIGYPQKIAFHRIIQIYCLNLIIDNCKAIDETTQKRLLMELKQALLQGEDAARRWFEIQSHEKYCEWLRNYLK